MDRDEGVRGIVFSAQKLTEPEFFELMNEPLLFSRELFLRLGAMSRIVLFRRKLVERGEVVHGALELAQRIEQRAETRNFFYFALGALTVRPKICGRHPLFQGAELAL